MKSGSELFATAQTLFGASSLQRVKNNKGLRLLVYEVHLG